MQCLCGNYELDNFNQYFDDDDETLMGVNCLTCEQEWLTEEYLNQSGENRIIFNGQSLTEQKNPLEKEQEQFQVKGSRTRIEADNFHILKPGDHISWHRPNIIWHHAIVEKIDLENKRIEVICYNKVGNTEQTKNKFQVVMQSTSSEEEWGKLYRIDYPKEVTDKNPPKLSLSRARSKLGETKYGFFSNNCESFAAFCNKGVSDSCQVRWLFGKIQEACGTAVGQLAEGVWKAVFADSKKVYNATVEKALESAGNLTAAEMIEHAINASNKVGAGIVIVLESGFLIWDLTKIYNKKGAEIFHIKIFLRAFFRDFPKLWWQLGLPLLVA